MKQHVFLHGHRLTFYRWGDGHPILLLHDMPGSAADWRFTMPALGEDLTCYAPDWPEHEIPDPCDFVRSFLDNRGICRTHFLAANAAWGLALSFSQRCPRRCGMVALLGAGPEPREPLPPGVAHFATPAHPDALLNWFGRRPRLVADRF